jgi:hypothetical protein
MRGSSQTDRAALFKATQPEQKFAEPGSVTKASDNTHWTENK